MKFKYISYFGFSLGRWVEVKCKGVFVMCYCKLGAYRVGRLANLAGVPRKSYYLDYLGLRLRFSLTIVITARINVFSLVNFVHNT